MQATSTARPLRRTPLLMSGSALEALVAVDSAASSAALRDQRAVGMTRAFPATNSTRPRTRRT